MPASGHKMTDPLVTTGSPADKVPIQAVVRAFAVLEALATRPTGARLADPSRMVGLHKATVYRLVRTMVLLGYVTQTADGEPYRVNGKPTERDSRRLAGGLFIPAERVGAGKSRDAAMVRPARRPSLGKARKYLALKAKGKVR